MAELLDILAKGAMRLSAPTSQSISDAFSVLEFDAVTVERGGMVCDVDANTISVPSTGIYSVHIGIDATFPGSEMIGIMVFVNGAAYSPHNLVLQGRNAKPVALFWESTVTLSENDTIDVRAISEDSGNFTLNLQRMYAAIIKEH
jgi:hypothetical protein